MNHLPVGVDSELACRAYTSRQGLVFMVGFAFQCYDFKSVFTG